MSSARKSLRSPLVYIAITASAAAALLVAYLFGAFAERGTIQANDVCQNVPDRRKVVKKLNSSLPSAADYRFGERQVVTPDSYFKSRCNVYGDEDELLLTLAAEMGSARPWQEWVEDEVPRTSGGDRTNFNAGVKGVSNAEVAAIWVPCYASEKGSKQPWNMTVFALVHHPLEASDKEARQTLKDLATDFARQAHKDAKCDLPSKLPG
ncbi:hypothetical protein [Streptomyces ortus]|jgi:hypothetical protein|uniref:Secreted protein n=1 Tax=Streptomyces ortus TaxID=2867268 RepID=A0ABT3V8H9_9ACTN|nr:hypothetical protein [Streptomyces ortus]MCX4235998.1 hypothetical protein [Streptomyces ortus]